MIQRSSSLQLLVLLVIGPFLSDSGCRKKEIENRPPARSASVKDQIFADATIRAGLHFVHSSGDESQYWMPQVIGSGAALFDYDNDGRLDILLVNNGGPESGETTKLFHQESDGTFRDATARSGLGIRGWGMGVAVGDVNNDGLPDVLLTQWGAVHLFLNRGDGVFEDVTLEAGLDDPHWATGASFFDYDRDGRLDLIIANYVKFEPGKKCPASDGMLEYCSPASFDSTSAQLYHNLGPLPGKPGRVHFEDRSAESGLGRLPAPGLGVVCADFNGDGWPDIFIANDGKPNHLWINRHDGQFREEAVQRGVAYNAVGAAQANMGVALADLGGNGSWDLYVTHLTDEGNVLWSQIDSAGNFAERTATAGLAQPRWRGTGFGAVFADFNNSGNLDLAVVNGRIRRSGSVAPDPGTHQRLGTRWAPYAERNQLFAGNHGSFHDVSDENPEFCAESNVFRGLACGDIWNNGAIGLLITTVNGSAKLYRNVAPNRGHWLTIRAVDPIAGGRDALGAVIELVAGGRRQHAEASAAGSYLSSSDPRIHFGLGDSTSIVSLVVNWPDGSTERFVADSVDRVMTLSRGSGAKVDRRTGQR